MAFLKSSTISGNLNVTGVVSASGYYPTSGGPGASLSTGSLYPITASWAVTASYAENGGQPGGSLSTGSTYPITSSWAIDVVNAPSATGTMSTGSTFPITSSWAIDVVNVPAVPGTMSTGSTFPITASWATDVVNTPAGITTGSYYPITASWSDTSSYITPINTFSRGGSFVDYGGLGGIAAVNDFLTIWRAPFTCNATAIYATHRSSTAGASVVTINARKNFSSLMLSASAPSISGSWAAFTALQNNTFAAGDTVEILLVSSSNYPEVVSIQVDFTR